MGKWAIEYQNDDLYEGFYEWWEATDGSRVFKSSTKEDAQWLCDALNGMTLELREATEKKGGVNDPPSMPPPPEPPKGQGGIYEIGMMELSLEGLPIHSISVNGAGDVPLIMFPQDPPLVVYKGMTITIRF